MMSTQIFVWCCNKEVMMTSLMMITMAHTHKMRSKSEIRNGPHSKGVCFSLKNPVVDFGKQLCLPLSGPGLAVGGWVCGGGGSF